MNKKLKEIFEHLTECADRLQADHYISFKNNDCRCLSCGSHPYSHSSDCPVQQTNKCIAEANDILKGKKNA